MWDEWVGEGLEACSQRWEKLSLRTSASAPRSGAGGEVGAYREVREVTTGHHDCRGETHERSKNSPPLATKTSGSCFTSAFQISCEFFPLTNSNAETHRGEILENTVHTLEGSSEGAEVRIDNPQHLLFIYSAELDGTFYDSLPVLKGRSDYLILMCIFKL